MEWWFHNCLTISNSILDASVLIGCNSTNMDDEEDDDDNDDVSLDNNKNKT
jgi:hypothetical protein